MGEHSKENNPPLAVQCYAGHKGTQRPQRFSLAEHWLEVEEILKEWREPDAVFFRVRADDGNIYVLRKGVGAATKDWSIEFVGSADLRTKGTSEGTTKAKE